MPIGQGLRIQKPRTAAQKANAQKHRQLPIVKAVDTAPRTSWWTECRSREEFDQKVKERRRSSGIAE